MNDMNLLSLYQWYSMDRMDIKQYKVIESLLITEKTRNYGVKSQELDLEH
jgi:hypothetical protein